MYSSFCLIDIRTIERKYKLQDMVIVKHGRLWWMEDFEQ